MNQSGELTANNTTPVRTDGDVLISFDFESSGNVVTLGLREWDATGKVWGAPRTLNIRSSTRYPKVS
jgi:hypothetical protein